MIIFEWKQYSPLKTMMGLMKGSSGESGGSDSGTDSGSDSGSSNSSSTSNSNSTSQSTLGTNDYTPGGLNTGFADSQGGKYGAADAGNSSVGLAGSQYSSNPMSWDQSVAADIFTDAAKTGSMEAAIADAIGRYGVGSGIGSFFGNSAQSALQQGVKDGLFDFSPSNDGLMSSIMAGRAADKGLSSVFSVNDAAKNEYNAAKIGAARAEAGKNNPGAATNITNPNNVTNPAPTVNPASPAAAPATETSGGIVANDGSGGRASAFGNESSSSSNKGIVGASGGYTNNGATVDNGSLASGGSGSLSAPSRNTDSIGFSRYNKDEANYDQDDWNRGMETQSSGLVSDEACKHFAKRAFSDGPHFKKARTLIIERLG